MAALLVAAGLASPRSIVAQPVTAGPTAPSAAAPSASAPDGVWWGVGVGAGALRFTCDLCAPDRDRGPSIFALLGAHAAPGLRVALEGGGWTRDDGGVREVLWRAGITGFLHPRPGSGLHLLAGLAWVGYRADDFRYDSGALSVGVGWELPLLPGWQVGNALRLDAASFGSFRNEGTRVVGDVGLSLIRLEVTVRRGPDPAS